MFEKGAELDQARAWCRVLVDVAEASPNAVGFGSPAKADIIAFMPKVKRNGMLNKELKLKDNAFDTYENLILGNFLFGLGLELGLNNGHAPVPSTLVDLHRQTNLDTRLCDVLIVNSRFFRMFEFKRAVNDTDKERSKLIQLTRALSSSKIEG